MKQKNIFTEVVFKNILKGFKAINLTTNSIVLLLQELVLYTNKNVLVSIENQEEAFDFYSKGQEHNQFAYTYFPESVGDNSVPGFEKENIRYQKESMLKTSGYNGVVCVGTPVSFKENIIPPNPYPVDFTKYFSHISLISLISIGIISFKRL